MSTPHMRKLPAIPEQIAAALEGVFSAHELGVLVGLGRVVEVDEGSTIVTEGADGDAAAVLLEGTVDVRHGDESIAKVGTGAIIGEMAILDDSPRTATLVAETAVTMMTLSHGGFVKLLQECPRLDQVVHSLAGSRASGD